MVTINISDELYTEITKTLNDTRNAKNSMTHELESQQLDLGTAISELKHPSAVVELMKASDNAQANIELLNKILRQVSVTSAFTSKKLSEEAATEILSKLDNESVFSPSFFIPSTGCSNPKMSKEEHLSHLNYLESLKKHDRDSLCVPRREGAFWFGHCLTVDEYISSYRKECIKEGWIDD